MPPDIGAGNPLASPVDETMRLIDRGERDAALYSIDQLLSELGHPEPSHPEAARQNVTGFQYDSIP
jgi:hypothetical protein